MRQLVEPEQFMRGCHHWECAMALATFGIVFTIGVALSQRFSIFVLFPATILTIISVVALGDGIGGVMPKVVLVTVALQIGYLVGLVLFATLASSGMTGRAWAFAYGWQQRAERLQSVK
jgi:hypothetical protein